MHMCVNCRHVGARPVAELIRSLSHDSCTASFAFESTAPTLLSEFESYKSLVHSWAKITAIGSLIFELLLTFTIVLR